MNRYLSDEVTELEKVNAKIALEVALEGIVLLKNDGVLPLETNKIALYGSGARYTVKGGTGSGDVNNRYNISIEGGLEKEGFIITTKRWLNDCEKQYKQRVLERENKIREIGKKYHLFDFVNMLNAISVPLVYPSGRLIDENDVKESETDTAILVISRQAGEGKDRLNIPGDYYLSNDEIKNLNYIVKHYSNTIVVINSGSAIDCQEIIKAGIKSIIFMGQAGQEGGLALAKLLSGKVNFSGKLAATWAKDISDFPISDCYSYLDDNVDTEEYKEGIYVGYRYFDSFNVEPQFPFGFGLSYTNFKMKSEICNDDFNINVKVDVTNIDDYSGKEVIQVYLTKPSDKLNQTYQDLVTFRKTKLLEKDGSQTLELSFDLKDFASYDEETSSYILEKGNYYVRVGNSSINTQIIGTIVLDNEVVVEKCKRLDSGANRISEINKRYNDNKELIGTILEINTKVVPITHEYKSSYPVNDDVLKLTDEELVSICVGDQRAGSITGLDIVGACGEFNAEVFKSHNYKPLVMADGPAGLRLKNHYYIEKNGKVKVDYVIPKDLMLAKKTYKFVNKFLAHRSKKAVQAYQYCTAFPCETVQAQTFSTDLIYKVGQAVSREMKKYNVDIWLAPGMNIQRHPLCGRNYEYYSEDPLLTAKCATALVKGVQENSPFAVTIKHYCCNNQEDNRFNTSSEINERTLREIYLKAFKLVIREAKPKCLMSSYNKVNGVYVNSSHQLINDIARNKFGFDGVIMTDWDIVINGRAVASDVLNSTNVLIMPGNKYQYNTLLDGIKNGSVDRKKLEESATRILNLSRKVSK